MAGAARQAVGRMPARVDRARAASISHGGAGGGRLVVGPVDADARRRAGARSRRTRRSSRAMAPRADGIARARMSSVKRTPPGITLTAPGSASIRPTVATSSSVSQGDALDRQDHLGRGGERVAAQRHRHGAGVAGLALTSTVKRRCAVDRGDDADRQALGLEHRALLDVHLDIGQRHPPGGAAPSMVRRVAAELLQRLAHADPVRVARLERRRSSVPATAREPVSVTGKRTPSSSPKASTSIAKGSRSPRPWRSATAAMAATTPRLPSYLPASRTVSMCEPSSSAGRPGSFPRSARRRCRPRRPALSIPAAAIQSAHLERCRLVRGREVEPGELARLVGEAGELVEPRRRPSGPGKGSRHSGPPVPGWFSCQCRAMSTRRQTQTFCR